MSDYDDNARRLLRALSAGEEAGDHDACLAALAEFVEAEMANEDVARLFPEVQAHLDTCQECDALHAEMLDLLMADEAGLISEPDHLPPLRMPREVLIRRWARDTAGAMLDALRQGRRELDSAAQAFFDALTRATGRLDLQAQSQAFALGETDSEALPLVMASYYALAGLVEQFPAADLHAMADVEQLQPVIERAAREEARRIGLKGQTAQTFITTFVTFALNNLPHLLKLATAPPHESSD
jgi:hypothetical protein